MAYNFKSIKNDIESELSSIVSVINEGTPVGILESWEGTANTWLCVLTVEIKNYSDLIGKNAPKMSDVTKIINSFSTNIIKMIKDVKQLLNVTFIGQYIVASFDGFYKTDLSSVFDLVIDINTFVALFNAVMSKRSLPTLMVGLGVSAEVALTIKKADTLGKHKYSFVTNIFEDSKNNANIANKGDNLHICMSEVFFNNIKEEVMKNTPQFGEWVSPAKPYNNDLTVYLCDVVRSEPVEWINNDFKDK